MYVVIKSGLTNLQMGDSYVVVVKFVAMVIIVMETEYMVHILTVIPGLCRCFKNKEVSVAMFCKVCWHFKKGFHGNLRIYVIRLFLSYYENRITQLKITAGQRTIMGPANVNIIRTNFRSFNGHFDGHVNK